MRYAPLLYPLEDEHLILGARYIGPVFNSVQEARQVAEKEYTQARKERLPVVAWIVGLDGETIKTKNQLGRTPNGAKSMDPNACFERWADAIARDDEDEAESAAADLIEWINRGGFEPRLWRDAKLKRIFVQWVRDSADEREENPKGEKKGAKTATKKMSGDDKKSLISALREFGKTVLKEMPKSFSKADAITGVVLASDLDRKEALKAVRKALPAPPKVPLTEEQKAARLAKRVASCERLLAGRKGGAPAAPAPKAETPKADEPKKKRGRPPKAKPEGETPKPKRPVGRPRKAAPVPASEAPKVEVEVKPSGTVAVEVTPAAPVAAPAPAPAPARVPMTQEEKMAFVMAALAKLIK